MEMKLGQVWESKGRFVYVIIEDYGKARPIVIDGGVDNHPTANMAEDLCGSAYSEISMYEGDVKIAESLSDYYTTQTKKLLDEAKRIFKDIIDMPGVEFDTDFAVSDWLEKYDKENK